MSGTSALVMEGGAMRGLFTSGVVDVLLEEGIQTDMSVGVSAGATFGCNYQSKQIGRPLRYNKRFCREPRYCSFRSLFLTGDLFGAKFCYETIPFKLDVFDTETFTNNPSKFYCVATNVDTGEALYHLCTTGLGEDLLWIRGSASMPMFARPVKVDGKTLLDGGISDSIPVRFAMEEGYDKIIVITTQPLGYEKKTGSLQGIIDFALRKYPKLVKAMDDRPRMYNETLAFIRQMEEEGRILVIRPPYKLPVNHIEHDPEKIQETYDIGRKTATKMLDAIKSYLNS